MAASEATYEELEALVKRIDPTPAGVAAAEEFIRAIAKIEAASNGS